LYNNVARAELFIVESDMRMITYNKMEGVTEELILVYLKAAHFTDNTIMVYTQQLLVCNKITESMYSKLGRNLVCVQIIM
jgi:hypothetical protein